MENYNALDDRAALKPKVEFSEEAMKQIFWQTSINDQIPKLKYE